MAYYIRSNGECTEYDFKSDSVFSKDGFEILPTEYLKIIETDKVTGRQEESNENGFFSSVENKWIIGAFIIFFGMLTGLIALIIINKKMFR